MGREKIDLPKNLVDYIGNIESVARDERAYALIASLTLTLKLAISPRAKNFFAKFLIEKEREKVKNEKMLKKKEESSKKIF